MYAIILAATGMRMTAFRTLMVTMPITVLVPVLIAMLVFAR